jgi:aerobic-type carbon monoxide dehydrogenase small subunit (CoxS/CutS family)
MVAVRIEVNGCAVEREVPEGMTLVTFLRDVLGLMGTKVGCEEGECGACTVLLDGEPVTSCILLAVQADGRRITTIEGLSEGDRLDRVQEAFAALGAVQCGFCTPGMVLAARALLDRNPRPTLQEIREAMSGNLCRCTGYTRIVAAVTHAASEAG